MTADGKMAKHSTRQDPLRQVKSIKTDVVNGLQEEKAPRPGLETFTVSIYSENKLGQEPSEGDAQSGAEAVAEPRDGILAPEMVAMRLLSLSLTDRARLAALLLGYSDEKETSA
jgi:hypothetical protein